MRRGKYIWYDHDWVPVEAFTRRAQVGPYIQSDLPAYKSPLGTGVVDGRAARREELKRHNCREVDPSEFNPVYRNPEFARKHGLELGGDPLPKANRLPTTIGPSVPGLTD